jgi:anthranilate synthase component 2
MQAESGELYRLVRLLPRSGGAAQGCKLRRLAGFSLEIPMILLIDNYDSFTYNLVQRLGEIDPTLDLEVHRNNQISLDEIARRRPTHIIVSPGPCTPREAGISCDVVQRFYREVPLLGVCLGHQSIGHAFGAEIVRAQRLMHGKTDLIYHDAQGLFAGLESPIEATRYHSLVIQPGTLSDEFEICAWANSPGGDTEIMGIRHREYPLFGLQFHPESFLTERGVDLLSRFLELPAPRQTVAS